MNKSKIIEEVKKLLFNSKLNFGEAKLNDGTSILWDGDTIGVDTEVYTMDDAGNKIPCPDGDYTLEDGTMIVVLGGKGKVSEVKPAVPETEVETEVELEKQQEVPVDNKVDSCNNALMEKLSQLEEKVKMLESSKEEMEKRMSEKELKLSKVQDATVYLAEEFSKTPAGDKVDIKASGYIDNFKKTAGKEEKLKDLIKFINQKEN